MSLNEKQKDFVQLAKECNAAIDNEIEGSRLSNGDKEIIYRHFHFYHFQLENCILCPSISECEEGRYLTEGVDTEAYRETIAAVIDIIKRFTQRVNCKKNEGYFYSEIIEHCELMAWHYMYETELEPYIEKYGNRELAEKHYEHEHRRKRDGNCSKM